MRKDPESIARQRPLTSDTEVRIRGDGRRPDDLFSYIRPEQRVPADHPLRHIRMIVDTVLRELSAELARLYAKTGHPSIPREKLLRGRSQRQLMGS